MGPHPSIAAIRTPRITRLDVSPAWRIPGVEVIVTAADVPGATYGLISADQPVFASDTILYAGQAVAAVAADHPETARRACEAIVVEYEALDPVTDPERAIEAPPLHPDGNVFRHQRIECGEEGVVGDVVVEGIYEIGMQDQAFLGLESALALPDSDGQGRRALHLDAVAARGPPPDRGVPRACPRSACGCSSPASGERSARARTSACKCTCACSRCAPGDP